MHLKTLDHVTVMVDDLDRSLAFYRDILGLKVITWVAHDGPEISTMVGLPNVKMREARMVAPQTGNMIIDLIEWVAPKGGKNAANVNDAATAHVAFGVEDIDVVYEDLKSKGVKFVSPPVLFPPSDGSWRALFFYDPDGFMLELIELKDYPSVFAGKLEDLGDEAPRFE
jgi:lactoylglutathione lyase